jgi:hypothetical protein
LQPIRALCPRLHFPPTSWVKAALLYWEGLVRIVPEGSTLQDAPEIHDLARAGLIEDVSPARYREAVKEQFLRRLSGVSQMQFDRPPAPKDTLESSTGRYSVIHVDEIDPGLREPLETYGLAASGGEWVTLSYEIAELYIGALAAEIGRHLHAAPAIDPSRLDAASYYGSFRRLAPDGAVPVDGYACARLLAPFPAIEANPISTAALIKGRQKLAGERRAFRDLVQARATHFVTLSSPDAIASHLRDFATEVRSELDYQRGRRTLGRIRDLLNLAASSASAAAPSAVADAAGRMGSLGAAATERGLGGREEDGEAVAYLASLERVVRRTS